MWSSAWKPEFEYLWPDSRRELLLRAALTPGSAAGAAFSRWRNLTGYAQYDDIDFESSRILPAVYANFVRTGIDDPWLPEMRGLHRYHLLRNANRRRDLLKVVELLNQRQVTPILLKGQALLAGGYCDNLGQRTMLDSDLLVAPEELRAAEEILAAGGWRPVGDSPPFPYGHACCWRRAEGDEIDLHLKMLHPPFGPIRTADLLPFAERRDVGKATFFVPDTTDLLLHTCVHGRLAWGRNPDTPFLWVADAHRLLTGFDSRVDWERLLATARRVRALFPLREALGYMADQFDCPVPREWHQRAYETELSYDEIRPFFRWTGPPNRYPSVMEMVDNVWDDYACVAESLGKSRTLSGMCLYFAGRVSKSLFKGVIVKRTARVIAKTLRHGRRGIVRPDLFRLAEVRLGNAPQ